MVSIKLYSKTLCLLASTFWTMQVYATSLQPKLSIYPNPYQYTSEYHDVESRLDYLHARYYDPVLRRFISRDTYHLLNLYAYGNGNPILNKDPSGHNVVDAFENWTEKLPALAQVGLAIAVALIPCAVGAEIGKSFNEFTLKTASKIAGGVTTISSTAAIATTTAAMYTNLQQSNKLAFASLILAIGADFFGPMSYEAYMTKAQREAFVNNSVVDPKEAEEYDKTIVGDLKEAEEYDKSIVVDPKDTGVLPIESYNILP